MRKREIVRAHGTKRAFCSDEDGVCGRASVQICSKFSIDDITHYHTSIILPDAEMLWKNYYHRDTDARPSAQAKSCAGDIFVVMLRMVDPKANPITSSWKAPWLALSGPFSVAITIVV